MANKIQYILAPLARRGAFFLNSESLLGAERISRPTPTRSVPGLAATNGHSPFYGYPIHILRNAFSERKITYFENAGKVLYRSAVTHGSNKNNFEIFPAGEFTAAITRHIPDKNYQMVGCHGWYSSRSRGDGSKKGVLRPGQTRGDPPHTKKPSSRTTCPVLGPICLNLVRKSRRNCA